jgi:conjugative relaxase-like TrwC/TraI family protein
VVLVKFTVTALGAAAGDGAGSARRIVAYLTGRGPGASRLAVGSFGSSSSAASAMSGYYRADQLEGDGWWGGQGAARLGLAGAVAGPVLEPLLGGRHHVTGERLVTAQGSSGRHGLKRGEHTRLVGGVVVWGVDDAAARFDTNHRELLAAAAGLDAGCFVTDADGQGWLTAEGIDALAGVFGGEEAAGHGEVRDRLDRLGEGWVTTGEAAALTGLTEQHYRQLIAEWHEHRDAIVAGLEGRALPHRRGWLPAVKERGRWLIETAELARFWERRRPPAVRLAYDVVATVEKSVAILALLSGEAVKEQCLDAVVAANEVGMGWLDQQASRGRRKGSSVGSEGFVWASFLHATSRALDPHPHVHNLVMNFLEDPFGGRRAVDARFLFVEARAASALATAQLRWELSCRFPGVGWVRHQRSPVWELAGISPELIREFSTRRSEIESAAARLAKRDGRLPTRGELQEISLATRAPKQVVDAASVLADWAERADRLGFDPDAVLGHTTGRRLPPSLSERERDELFQFLAISADGVCQEESTFNRGDVLAAVNRWAPGGQPRPVPAATVVELANDFLATRLAIPVEHDGNLITRRDGRPAGTMLHEERWTTPDMVRTQLRIVSLWGQGIAGGHLAGIDPAAIDQAGQAEDLSPEQVELVRAWTSSGDRFQAAIGQPGTGKTFTMRAARRVWEQHGYQVLGAAVKGTAAQHLGRQTGIPSETIAHHLAAARRGDGRLDARTVLVVDEATTVSDRDLCSLMNVCAQTGAVLRMIGDPAQQQAVAAGGMWEHMVGLYRSRTPELSEQRRLLDPTEIHAAGLLRRGRIDQAFDALLAGGKIRQADDPTQAELVALAGWLERHQRGIHAPMIDRRNTARERLNLIAQAIRVNAGEVTDLHRYGDRELGAGDHVVATRPNRRRHPDGDPARYLSNGSIGTVTAASDTSLRVGFDGLGEIDLPASEVAAHLDLGYALTAYSVQGLTLDEAEATARPGEEIHALYVMLTRGRHSNTLITTRPLPGETHGPAPAPDRLPVVDVAENIVDATLQPAIAIDHHLARLIGPGGDPASVTPGHTSGDVNLDRRLHEVEEARAVRHALNHPPAGFRDRFPARPATPWLARTWDTTLAAVTAYRFRWRPPDPPAGTATGHPSLGPEPAPGTPQHHQWARAAAIVEDNAVTIALRHLDNAGNSRTTTIAAGSHTQDRTRPDQLASPHLRPTGQWLERFLRRHASTGGLGPDIDYTALAGWVDDIDTYRRTHGLAGHALLGPPPGADSDVCADWQAVVARAPLQVSHRPPTRAMGQRTHPGV